MPRNNCVSPDRSYFRISPPPFLPRLEVFPADSLIKVVHHGWTRPDRSVLTRDGDASGWKERRRESESTRVTRTRRNISRSRHGCCCCCGCCCYRGSRSDRTVLKYRGFRDIYIHIYIYIRRTYGDVRDPRCCTMTAVMEEVRGREETSSSNLRRLQWTIHIRKGRHRRSLIPERQ